MKRKLLLQPYCKGIHCVLKEGIIYLSVCQDDSIHFVFLWLQTYVDSLPDYAFRSRYSLKIVERRTFCSDLKDIEGWYFWQFLDLTLKQANYLNAKCVTDVKCHNFQLHFTLLNFSQWSASLLTLSCHDDSLTLYHPSEKFSRQRANCYFCRNLTC